MTLTEILKANGIDDEVVGKITADMKSNRIFTAGEENLDIRYAKLKNEHATSTQTISDLQKQIAEYEVKVARFSYYTALRRAKNTNNDWGYYRQIYFPMDGMKADFTFTFQTLNNG